MLRASFYGSNNCFSSTSDMFGESTKATDQNGVIFYIEIQIAVRPGLVQRLVFYGCEEYAGQLQAGNAYTALKPVVNETELSARSLAELQAITTDLQRKFQNRNHG